MEKVIGKLNGWIDWYDGPMFNYDVEEMVKMIEDNNLNVGDKIKITISVDYENIFKELQC